MQRLMNLRRFAGVCACLLTITAVSAGESMGDAGSIFGQQKLVQEIDCAQPNKDILFVEYPKAVSKVETVLGTPCRVLANASGDAKYFAYRIGEDLGLKAGAAYMVAVEFPDDKPRSMFIANRGCETSRGVRTGSTTGDTAKGRYTNHNTESMQIPQSGKFITFRQFFYLHDRFAEVKVPRGRGPRPLVPEDGFWLILSQPKPSLNPMSAGVAVSKIRLFEIEHPERYYAEVRYPPEDLPKRHLFWREEMADGVVSIGHKPEEKLPENRGVTNTTDWFEYKIRLMKVLGMNTFAKDLLEFGHNQGWDSAKYGGSSWYNQSAVPDRWNKIIDMIAKYKDISVLPYYEYAGSIGQDPEKSIGTQRHCERLSGGKDYTHIPWVHKTNADLADPDFIEDARRILEITITENKDKVPFLGAWFRPRPEANPISFNKKNLKLFSKEANDGNRVTRDHLKADKELLEKYYKWWFGKRREWMDALTKYLRENVNPDAMVLYTTDASEPGISLSSKFFSKGKPKPWEWKTLVVTDQVEAWRALLPKDPAFKFVKAVSYDTVVAKNLYGESLLQQRGNWGKWEWQHACPWNDPQNYADSDGPMLSYSFNRLYTVSTPKAFEPFRTKRGLAMLRHYSLNENEMNIGKEELLGYFVADVERAGPYCMLVDARAMAYGDPRYIGYLVGSSFTRGFPEYARAFNLAFLSLPALPSVMVANACADKEVVLREIKTEKHGTYVAIVNVGFTAKANVEVTLPAQGTVTDAPTGKAVAATGGKLKLSLYPGELRALQIK